jgi:hypothetical protein
MLEPEVNTTFPAGNYESDDHLTVAMTQKHIPNMDKMLNLRSISSEYEHVNVSFQA